MTVSELIAILQKTPPDAEVYLCDWSDENYEPYWIDPKEIVTEAGFVYFGQTGECPVFSAPKTEQELAQEEQAVTDWAKRNMSGRAVRCFELFGTGFIPE